MKSVIKQAALAAFLASVGVLAVSQSRPVHAADKAQAKSPVMRKEVGAPFNDAVKLFLAKDFAGAKVKAELADMVPMKTPYEEYSVAKLLGTIALNQAMPDYATATTDWERMIASGGAPDMDKGAMYTTAMKLHYQAMQYPKAIADATEVQKIQPLDDGGYRILANSYYSANDFPNTIQTAKAANAAKVAAGMAPSEDILRMELSAQHKLMDDAGYRETLDQLATVSPQMDVWDEEIAFAFNTKGITDHQVLNLYRLSLAVGAMKDADYKAMASVDLTNGLPAEAKAVLAKGNVSGELVTQANSFLAKDQSVLSGLPAEAAKQKNGEVDVKLGESYLTYGRNDEAIAAIQKGIDKGGLKDTADAETTLGISLFNAGKKMEAVAVFDKAAMANSPSAAVAHVWSLYARHATA